MFCFKNNFNDLKLNDIYYFKIENANTFILINLLKFNFTFLNQAFFLPPIHLILGHEPVPRQTLISFNY